MLSRSVMVVLVACSACNAGPESSVAIGVLNLEEEPRRLIEVCLERRCTGVNTVLDHGDEAIVTVNPRGEAAVQVKIEKRGGKQEVLPCAVRLHAGSSGAIQIALSQSKLRVLENKLHDKH